MPQLADAKSILTTFTIRSFLQTNITATKRLRPLYVTVEILDPENVQHAISAGANEVIESTRLSYSMLSHSIAQKGTGGVVSSIISARAQNIYVISDVKGLGLPVLRAVSNQYLALGLLNGLAIVILAIIFDRVSQQYGRRLQAHREGSAGE